MDRKKFLFDVKVQNVRHGLLAAFILLVILFVEYFVKIAAGAFSLKQALFAIALYGVLLFSLDTIVLIFWAFIRWSLRLTYGYFSLLLCFSVFVVAGSHMNKHLLAGNFFSPRSVAITAAFGMGCLALGLALFLLLRNRSGTNRRERVGVLSPLFGILRIAAFIGLVGVAIPWPRHSSVVATRGPENPIHIFIIVLDALRPDHLSCYGYVRDTSPNIDQLLPEATLFRNAYCAANWTVASVSSIFTGLPPAMHQVFEKDNRLPESAETIAEILKSRGWKTGFFMGIRVAGHEVGFSQGFDLSYPLGAPRWSVQGETAIEQAVKRLRMYGGYEAFNAKNIFHSVTKWLEADRRRPAFAYVHLQEPHWPYNPPAPYNALFSEEPLQGKRFGSARDQTPEELEKSLALYDGDIAYTDFHVGIFLKYLKEMELYDKSLIIVSADHGEEFYEHGGWGHGQTLYEETVHVPLIIKPPAACERVRESDILCGLTDIFPTVLDYAEIEHPEVYGRSLAPAIEGKPMEVVPVISSASDSASAYPYLNALRTPEYTLIEDNRAGLRIELYSRITDPKEGKDIADGKLDIAQMLHAELKGHVEAQLSLSYHKEIYEVSEERMRALRDLGYLE